MLVNRIDIGSGVGPFISPEIWCCSIYQVCYPALHQTWDLMISNTVLLNIAALRPGVGQHTGPEIWFWSIYQTCDRALLNIAVGKSVVDQCTRTEVRLCLTDQNLDLMLVSGRGQFTRPEIWRCSKPEIWWYPIWCRPIYQSWDLVLLNKPVLKSGVGQYIRPEI